MLLLLIPFFFWNLWGNIKNEHDIRNLELIREGNGNILASWRKDFTREALQWYRVNNILESQVAKCVLPYCLPVMSVERNTSGGLYPQGYRFMSLDCAPSVQDAPQWVVQPEWRDCPNKNKSKIRDKFFKHFEWRKKKCHIKSVRSFRGILSGGNALTHDSSTCWR